MTVAEATEEEDERQCRFCFGGDEDGELIAPCLCCGDQKWIHVVRSRCIALGPDPVAC